MNNELVSLILPIFNIKFEYLKKCLSSLLNQTYENLEIILVDDGSTNNVSSLCQKYIRIDQRIRLIRQQNQGAAVARNTGLKAATGKYICFIDPDDWISVDYVFKLLKGIKKTNADFVVADCFVAHGESVRINHFLNLPETDLKAQRKNLLLYQLVGKKICSYYPPLIAAGVPWGKMFQKNFIEKNDLHFFPWLRFNEDNVFCLYAVESARSIHYLPEPLYYYRKNSSSTSLKYTPLIINYFEDYFDETFKFLSHFKKEKKMYFAAMMKELTSFNSILGQYFFNKKNPDSYRQAKKKLDTLLSKKRYQYALNNVNYSYLTKSEAVFVFCLKHHFYFALKSLIKLRNYFIF